MLPVLFGSKDRELFKQCCNDVQQLEVEVYGLKSDLNDYIETEIEYHKTKIAHNKQFIYMCWAIVIIYFILSIAEVIKAGKK
jgi:hypothetical protein